MLGAPIYQQLCAACHGAHISAGIAPHPLTNADAMWRVAPASAFQVTKFGGQSDEKPALQAYLTDEQLWQALFYAWSLHTDAEEVAAGATMYATQCAVCHGEQGRGDGIEAPDNLLIE